MTPILAILVDSLRELRARKLFWFVLAISALIIIAFGSIGFNEEGVSILFGFETIESDYFREGTELSRVLLEGIFSGFIVNIWLAWGAVVLALISTASIFPDFVSGGSIDLVLSKPVRRTTIFLTKYLGGLLFVLLQVAIFCLGAFFILRWRLGEWRWGLFIAVPLVVLMFSYLYSVMTVVGVWTRSTLAALVVTLLVWFGLFGAQSTGNVLLQIRAQAEQRREEHTRLLEMRESEAAKRRERGDEEAAGRWDRLAEMSREEVEEAQGRIDALEPWQRWANVIVWALPKTQDTVNLVQRTLEVDRDVSMNDVITGRIREREAKPIDAEEGLSPQERQRRASERVIEEVNRRRPWYIIGTSVAFEAVIVAIGLWIFARRDF